MIIRDLLTVLWRRWPITAIVLLVTVLAGAHLMRTSGVYTTRTVVAFTIPGETELDDGGSAEPGIITFAATVASEVDRNAVRPTYSDVDARAYGIGVRQGVFVSVPDVGGQWTIVYRKAEVYIEVVGPTFEWVQEQQDATIAAVIAAANAQQEAIGVPDDARVKYTVDALSKDIEHVEPSRSTQVVALAALGVAGTMVAAFAATWWDKRRSRRRSVTTGSSSRFGGDPVR